MCHRVARQYGCPRPTPGLYGGSHVQRTPVIKTALTSYLPPKTYSLWVGGV